MASVVIAGDVSGTCTLQAANAAGTTVLTLPTTSGTLVSSGSVPAAGSTTQVQYNSSGNLAGSSSFVFDGTNVGIGTSSPGANNKLHVSSAGTTRLYVENTANSVGVRLQTLSNAGLLQTDTNHPLTFATNNGSEAMRIATSGNVGIGTSSPTEKLVVDGSIKLSGLNSGAGLLFDLAGSSDYQIKESSTTDVVQFGGSATTGFRHNISSGAFQFNSGYGSIATAYGCRAWVNFVGSSGTINGSGGVSSVTRNSTGNYTVTFSFTLPDTTYAVTGGVNRNNGAADAGGVGYFSQATGSVGVYTYAPQGSFNDATSVSIAIFR